MITLTRNYNMEQLIVAIKKLIARGESSDLVKRLANSIVTAPGASPYPVVAIHKWASTNIRYQYDNNTAAALQEVSPDGIELLISPERMAEDYYRGVQLIGDCDCTALFITSALRTLGIKTRFAILAIWSKEWDHAATYAWSEVAKTWLFIEGTSSLIPVGTQPVYYKQLLVE
jgi:hypothetical protein